MRYGGRRICVEQTVWYKRAAAKKSGIVFRSTTKVQTMDFFKYEDDDDTDWEDDDEEEGE